MKLQQTGSRPIRNTSSEPRCPVCGHPYVAGVATRLPYRQRALFEIIDAAGVNGIRGPEIMRQLYADDPAGGPLSPNIISVMCNHINRKIMHRGLKLGAGAPFGYYRLMRL